MYFYSGRERNEHMKKKIIVMMLSFVLVMVSVLGVETQPQKAEAASTKWISGECGEWNPQTKGLNVYMRSNSIKLKGVGYTAQYPNGKKKKYNKVLKVAGNCKIKTGDEEVRFYSYSKYRKKNKVKSNKAIVYVGISIKLVKGKVAYISFWS